MPGRKRGKLPPAEDHVSRERQHQKFSTAIYELYGDQCWLCGRSGADTIDHVVPVLWGGSDHPANLKPACRSCNSSRGAARPPKKAWTIPAMWLDGYGPNSRRVEDAYPKPSGLHPLGFVSLFLIAATLVWVGIRLEVGVVTLVGAVSFGLLVLVPYARWWFWNLTSHRLLTAAQADQTPLDPNEWLREASISPPGLRQIGRT